MSRKTIKVGLLHRAATVVKAGTDEETLRISFSSETPVERYFGMEILDHGADSVDMSRLLNKAPVLAEHDPRMQIGVVEGAFIDGGKSYADIRWGNSATAKEYRADVEDLVKTHVSVGYRVNEMKIEERGQEGRPDIYRVTRWQPLEVSFTSMAADDSVGPGRGEKSDKWVREFSFDIPEEMALPEAVNTKSVKEDTMIEKTPVSAPEVDVDALREQERAAEAQRQKDIRSIADNVKDISDIKDLARQFCDSGKSASAFLAAINERRDSAGSGDPIDRDPQIGMSDKEVKQFRLMRLIDAMSDPRNRSKQEAAAFEFEACSAAADKAHRAPEGMFVPADVVMRGQAVTGDMAKRDITVGPGGTGQYLVDDMMMPMIDALQNQMYVRSLGAQVFTGLTGDLSFPRENAQASIYWVGEGDDTTESTPGFNQVGMTPKTAGTFTDLTRKTIQQSSLDVEAWLRGHLALKLAIAMDLAAIHGSGAGGEPLGICNTSGIGSVVGGANGAEVTYAHVCALEKEVAVDNALRGRLAFLTNPKVRWKLRQTPENATVPNSAWVWNGGLEGEVLGYPAFATNQVSSTLLKTGSSNTGAHSAVIYGNWNDLYVGLWGGLDINVDTATLSKSGGVRVVALQDCDVALAHPQSFAAMLDAITA